MIASTSTGADDAAAGAPAPGVGARVAPPAAGASLFAVPARPGTAPLALAVILSQIFPKMLMEAPSSEVRRNAAASARRAGGLVHRARSEVRWLRGQGVCFLMPTPGHCAFRARRASQARSQEWRRAGSRRRLRKTPPLARMWPGPLTMRATDGYPPGAAPAVPHSSEIAAVEAGRWPATSMCNTQSSPKRARQPTNRSTCNPEGGWQLPHCSRSATRAPRCPSSSVR